MKKALTPNDIDEAMPAILINVKGEGAPPRDERVQSQHWGYNPKVIGQVLEDKKAISHVGIDLASFLAMTPGDS